ncbi:DDE superfamily endonuclease domain-containing protein [Hirsutella rhossiliensis]|uniref:DDE superfamily endonuclease domain-containing protein n=1 Tax=Hirsutella rhossiliensis TaxID=111463 RepID=A0A9P8SFW7_9HYPO|nr:DDE superfamily endonuclease domain-containing protein [Hirsutella rhossiliensis]KAH0960499.1 DDE superfamily endonuclease domain-containing protein [Hirsutella rhossiliensis]
MAASAALRVPYYRLRSRIQGNHPKATNGGNRTLLSPEEEKEVLCWAHRRITQGHHIQQRSLQQHANAILKATGRGNTTASGSWARRFIKRYKQYFHRRKAASETQSVKSCKTVKSSLDSTKTGIGFMVGLSGYGLDYCYRVNLRDRQQYPPFLILPGHRSRPKGYVNDILALEFIDHFERHTRPQVPEEERLVLMDGCENHFTYELVHFCYQHNIQLFPLPPHVTNLLQPLDVGVFGPYKHWHQQVLYREIANGATNFNKTDFLFHLQEMRNRTFKRPTILSAWEKSGLFPFNPSVVLDQLQDALSSLTDSVRERELPGFVEEGTPIDDDSSNEDAFENMRSTPQTPTSRSIEAVPGGRGPATPVTVHRIDWKTLKTPRLNLHDIHKCHEFIRLRIDLSIASGTPITPSVAHVQGKVRKAAHTLALNGITATDEMRRLKENQLRRSKLAEGTSIVGKFGPLTVHDSRLRVAKDEYNRLAAQADEARRRLKKEVREEAAISKSSNKQLRLLGRDKRGLRSYMDSIESICYQYAAFRALGDPDRSTDCPFAWIWYNDITYTRSSVLTWPKDYDREVVQKAVELVILETQERSTARRALTFEVDGIEITEEIVIDGLTEEFEAIIKEE